MTNYPQLNIELLDAVVDFAAEHDTYNSIDSSTDSTQIIWRQPVWRMVSACGTFMCVAGITCHITGAQWFNNELGNEYNAYVKNEFKEDTLLSTVSAETHAVSKLGLTSEEASYLFDGSYRSVDELKLRAKRISNGEFRGSTK